MKKYHIAAAYALSMALLSAMPAGARQLTPEEALGRIQSEQPHRVAAKSNLNISTQTIEDEGKPSFYVFSQSGVPGYIIAPADDRLPSVIGYTDNGEFEYDRLPSPVKWLLDQYNESRSVTSSPHKRTAYKAITPLLNTEWGQRSPYNDQCPISYDDEKCPAGCVAVAMAQVMRYHKYPAKIGDTEANWDKMPVTLSEYSPKESIDAVARLISQCGQSVDMKYGTVNSQTYNQKIPRALSRDFGYDSSVRFELLKYYSTDEWLGMIYEELKAKRPVIMNADSDSGEGHTFVCDGIDSNGLLHINWGWKGLSDGYYNLTGLNPAEQGTGGSDDPYTCNFGLVTHIMPEAGGKPYYPIYGLGGTIYDESNNKITTQPIGIGNYSYNTFNGAFGLISVDSNGNEFVTATQITRTFNPLTESAACRYATNIPNMKPSGLQPGEYRVYLAVKPDGYEWQKVRSPYTMPQYVLAIVDNSDNITYRNSEAPGKPEILTYEIEHDSHVIPGKESEWKLKLHNSSVYNYENTVSMHFLNRNSHEEVTSVKLNNISLNGGDTRNFDFDLTLDLTPGEYEVFVSDAYGRKTGEPRPIYVGKPDVEVENISVIYSGIDVTDDYIDCKLGDQLTITATVLPANATDKAIYWVSSDPSVASIDNQGNITTLSIGETDITAYSVDGSDIEGEFELYVNAKIDVNSITLNRNLIEGGIGTSFQLIATVLPENADNKLIEWSSEDEEVATVSGSGLVTINSEGETRIVVESESDSFVKAYCTVRGSAGISDIIADSDTVDIYSVEGLLLKSGVKASAANELPHGIYIMKSATATIKISR